MARLEKQAQWLQGEHPDAAASLREDLEEMFTVNRLGLSPSLVRCLGSTNIIEPSKRPATALGCLRVPDHREECSQDPRLPRPVDAESGVASDRRRKSGELDGAGGIECITPLPTSNGAQDTFYPDWDWSLGNWRRKVGHEGNE
jgi:hypothetical protein